MDKNKAIIALAIVLIAGFGINIYLKVQNNNLAKDYDEIYAKYSEIFDIYSKYMYSEDECMLWIVKDDVGFASPTEYCGQLKVNCNSNYHNLNCEWIESQLVDENNIPINITISGCQCIGA